MHMKFLFLIFSKAVLKNEKKLIRALIICCIIFAPVLSTQAAWNVDGAALMALGITWMDPVRCLLDGR